MINFCWCCFKWGLVLTVVGVAVAAFYVYERMNDEIRRQAVNLIAQHYDGLKVTARSAGLVEGGLEVRGLSIIEPGAEGAHAELIYLDEVYLECSTDWEKLLQGELQATQITIRRPKILATHRPDGTWSVAKLLPLPKFSERPPKLIIENGTIEIFDPLKSPSSTLTLRDVNLTIGAPDPSSSTPHVRQVQGMLSADHLRRIEVQGLVEPERESWTIEGKIDGLDISPELRDSLPAELAAKAAVLGELRGQGMLDFRVSYDPAATSSWGYYLSGRLKRGHIDDPRLPQPLSDMRAIVRLNNDGFVVDELVARSGQAKLWMSARRAGFDATSPLEMEAEIQHLELDNRLLDCLPEALQNEWHRYLPAGEINAVVTLTFDGKTWNPDVSVECLDVSFTHWKFPYRLEQGKGSVTLKDDLLKLNLIAYSRSQAVRVKAEVSHPISNPTFTFEAKGDGLQLDKKFFDALKVRPPAFAFVHSLHPDGKVDFHVQLWREEPKGPIRKQLSVDLNRCSIEYEKFPYPLRNIRGRLEMQDDHWTFRQLEGSNDAGRVQCEGYMTTPQQGHRLHLHFKGENVPLQEDLRDALRPNIQRVWNDLQPQGVVNLDADVDYWCAEKKLSVGVTAQPQGDTTSIQPARFPYRMEKLQGVLSYRDGHVTLKSFRAEHGRINMAASGYCGFLGDGSWDLHLERLCVDRLHLDDRELIRALPGQLKRAILELKPRGPVNLRGSFRLQGGARVDDPLRSRWDLAIDFHRGSIDCGVKLENLHGSMTLAGGFHGGRFHSLGELDIDSLTFKDHQFTQVRGPVWLDDGQVLLGSWVQRRQSNHSSPDTQRQPRPLTAKLFGGAVYGDGWVSLGPEPRYGFRANLSRADLSRCAQEVMAGRQNLKGKVMATVDLEGTGRSVNGLRGRGNVRLRDADIYQLPLMVALLKILSIREPDPTAFSKSNIDFTIQGNHIYFQRIDFNGDAISLLGRGQMDFQSNVDLTFQPIVGNDEVRLPLFSDLLGGASQQIMKISVSGTLQNPQTRKEPFPGVNQALQDLQDGIQKGAVSPGFFPPSRQSMPDARSESSRQRYLGQRR